MKDSNVIMQAKIYLYDLNNCALENGFTSSDGWELNRVTVEEKMELERKYQNTVSHKILPELLAEFFTLVKEQLMAAQKMLSPKQAEVTMIPNNEQRYLVAFNPNRLKR